MSHAAENRVRELIERYGVAGVRAIATKAVGEADDDSRALLAEQLERQEQRER